MAVHSQNSWFTISQPRCPVFQASRYSTGLTQASYNVVIQNGDFTQR